MLEGEAVKIASDNTIKNSLINFDADFSGLKDVLMTFFPSMLDEIVLRYRAKTVAKIGIEAYRIAKNESIQINPIPPKIALPLIEKMSLEHEPDMYGKWARLLIATGIKPNPIDIQYADLLSNLNYHSANFLKDIYKNQPDPGIERKTDEAMDRYKFQMIYYNEERSKRTTFDLSEYGNPSIALPPLPPFLGFPLIMNGTEESVESCVPFYENGKSVENKYNILKLSNDDSNMLLALEKLGLIRCYSLPDNEKKDEKGKRLYIRGCGVLLTNFGHSFVDCLEHPTK